MPPARSPSRDARPAHGADGRATTDAVRPRHFACPVHGTLEASGWELRVIDSPPFQRLRRIKQLGNSHLVFPGATHTRFSHSLGVMHLAGQLFDSILAGWEDLPGEARAACARVRARVRLAGLLHDTGHGPYSHHFESMLATWRGGAWHPLRYGAWDAPGLRVPDTWIKPERRAEFDEGHLAHEHYTYGVVRALGEWFSRVPARGSGAAPFDAQGIVSLLDERIRPSASLDSDLGLLVEAFADLGFAGTGRAPGAGPRVGRSARGPAGARARASLHKCLKSILSSDIDADRMDYLQRDALSCGVRSALDLRHLFASVRLSWEPALARYVVLVQPNAVGVIEQILIARKQMFDQVYQHRVTVAFDALLRDAVRHWMRVTGHGAPRTLRDFLALTDDALDGALEALVGDAEIAREPRARVALKMYVTRTPPVVRDERVVAATDVAQMRADLRALHGRAGLPEDEDDVLEVSLKEFFKANRETLDSSRDVLFVRRARPAEAGARASLPPTPLRLYSEVLRSTAWRDAKVRVVVNRPLTESAILRRVDETLSFASERESPPRKEQEATHAKTPRAKTPRAKTTRAKTDGPQTREPRSPKGPASPRAHAGSRRTPPRSTRARS